MEEDSSSSRPDAGASAEATDAGWRAKLVPEAREKVIMKLLENLKRTLPISGLGDLNELQNIAIRCEDKIYNVASSQGDYLSKIAIKMITMEKSQHAAPVNSLVNNTVNQSPAEPASFGIQPQVSNQGQSSILVVNQPSAVQQLLPQGIQTSSLQNMSGTSQNSARSFVGPSPKQDIYANAQRVMQERQQQKQILSQQQQQSQNQFLYEHQLQQKLLKQKFQHPSLLQPHLQQQPQSLLQTAHLQSSKQPLMQMSSSLKSGHSTVKQTQSGAVQTAAQSGFQPNQLSSVQQAVPSLLQQHPPTVARQQLQVQPTMHQQMPSPQQLSASVPQLSSLELQSNLQQLMGPQAGILNVQQGQMLGQQLNVTDMQQQLQMAPVQGNNPLNMQQPQQMLNHNTISLHHHQQLRPQTNVSGQQQQQQQQQQSSMASLQPHGQQPQHQSVQQQLISQSLLGPLPQHLAMHQNPNFMQQELQQLQASSALLSVKVEQQKQFVQSQRGLPNTSSSTSLDSTSQTRNEGTVDWQEEFYQKIKSWKELYFAELNELYQKIDMKLQQGPRILPRNQTEQYEKLKSLKFRLQHILQILQISKSNIQPAAKDKLHLLEKQIVNIVASNKRKVITSQPTRQQQFLPSGGQAQSMPHQQPSQAPWSQQHDDPANQVHQTNLHDSAKSMQSAACLSMQHGSMPLSTPFVPMTQQNKTNASYSGSPVDQVQGNSFSSLQQGAIISKPQGGMVSGQNAMNELQQTNANTLNSTMNALQNNASYMQQSPSGPQLQQLQHQQQGQQQQCVTHSQQVNQQLQQYHMQQQLIQRQQMQRLQPQEQHLQQQKHQQAALRPLSTPNEVIELKVAQRSGMKSGFYQQHSFPSQRHSYYQHLKSAPEFSVSPPQQLKALSPQISQHSPQIDQHCLLSSQLKAGSPLQLASSPFISSPSTPLGPSPLPGDSDKPLPGTSSLPNAAHIGYQKTDLSPPQVQSLAVDTPGISASPLLAEFTCPDGNHSNLTTEVAGKTSAVEEPLERLIKVVQSSPPEVLSSAVGDIGSVISMMDSIASSEPGNGSRAAAGEDLVAMTKCHLQARNFMKQDSRKKMKRDTFALILSDVLPAGSVSDSVIQSYDLDASELKSTATSCAKRQKVEVNYALLEEIGEINQQLIDTVVNIIEEDADSIVSASEVEGTVIKCSFMAVALSPSLKSQFASAQMSPILPLRLLVPANYPKSSPVLLDKLDKQSGDYDDLATKTRLMFDMFIRGLSDPTSLREMAKAWDVCARKVITEYAQQIGGGSFSTRYGAWENCVGA